MEKIKQCTICKKRFIESKGFHQNGNGKYYSMCKDCRNERYKQDQYTYHKFIEINDFESECSRCGLIRRKKASKYFGQWIVEYKTSTGWTTERPNCIQ